MRASDKSSTEVSFIPEGARQPQLQSLITASFFILAIGALYLGREFFIPFAMATLLAFALSPIVASLRRVGLPKGAAVGITVLTAMAVIASLGYIVAHRFITLADSLPQYQQSMQAKIHTLRSSATSSGGVFDRITGTVEGLEREVTTPKNTVQRDSSTREPLPVILTSPPRSPVELLEAVGGPLIGPITSAGLLVVFLVFILLKGDDLRDRFTKLLGGGNLQLTTQAMSDAGDRVSRYLLMQLVVNIIYGIPIGIGLAIIGVPNALLWGFLAAVFKFVPFLGPFLAAVCPVVLAFAIDPAWSTFFWVLGLFVFVELFSSNVIEPRLYGSSTGLSSLAIMSAAIFWTTLWGTVGLILATPLTVCLFVIGRYVPQLQFLGVLLGSDPVLKAEEQFYQRLLAGNVEGALEIAEADVEHSSTHAFYDSIAIPSLRLAQNDRQRSAFDGTYRRIVADTMVAVIHELADHKGGSRNANKDQEHQAIRALGVPHLCIGGRTDLDQAAAEMVAQAVEEKGISAHVLAPISISQHAINQMELAGVDVVCISYFEKEPDTYVKFASRRLKKKAPELKIVVCLWNAQPAKEQPADLAARWGVDSVAFSVEHAVMQVDSFVAPHLTDAMQPAAMPSNEAERLVVLKDLGFTTGQSKEFDILAAKVAAAFETPIALVTVIDEESQRWPGAVGLSPKLDASRVSDRATSICGHVVALNEILVVEDIAKDARFANNRFLIENGIRFYAGVPLRTLSGFAIGSLCILDSKPRSFSEADRKVLRSIADGVMLKVEAQHDSRKNDPAKQVALQSDGLQSMRYGIA